MNEHIKEFGDAMPGAGPQGETGIMSFIVNQDRVIFQSDLGDGTKDIAATVTRFDPGPGWTAVPD